MPPSDPTNLNPIEVLQYPIKIGDACQGRYTIIRTLGAGNHADVWLAFDKMERQHVAIKISKSPSFDTIPTQSSKEVKLLQKIASGDANHPGYHHVLHLLDTFQLRGVDGYHQCIVTEVLGPSVHAFRTAQNRVSLPLDIVKQVVFQLLEALDYLHNTCGIIHTDLKPDNILLKIHNPETVIQKFLQRCEEGTLELGPTPGRIDIHAIPKNMIDHSDIVIKLIDYGNACSNEPHSYMIQPSDFRSPEVILGAEWDSSADIWNLACLTYEMVTSKPLFYPGKEANDATRLSSMIQLIGPFSPNLIASGTKSTDFFDEGGNFCIPDLTTVGIRALVAFVRPEQDHEENEKLASFLRCMTTLPKCDRFEASELLTHPWLGEVRKKYRRTNPTKEINFETCRELMTQPAA